MDLKSLFKRGPEEILGIDLSSWGIKAVGLGGSAQNPVLETLASAPLAAGCIGDAGIEKMDDVANALRALLAKHRIKTKNVALALPSAAVITKKITIRADLQGLDLEDQVETEARQYIPFPLEDVRLDFCEIGPNPLRDDLADVLIAAARRERVESLQELADLADLVPVVVDVQSYALQSAMERLVNLQFQDKKDILCALFKIGASRTVLQVSRGGEIVYERDQGVGGDQLTQRIAEHYGYSPSDAEKRKQAGNLPQDYESAVLAPFVGAMVQVFERGTHLFFNSTAFNKLDQVFLAGGGALVGGLAASISSALQAPCSVVNPFEGMTLGASLRKQEGLQSAPMYLGACGLALRRFQA